MRLDLIWLKSNSDQQNTWKKRSRIIRADRVEKDRYGTDTHTHPPIHTHTLTDRLSGGACQRSNTPCLVSSKLTGWQTCLSVLCQYSLGPLVMGHTPNDRSRSFPLASIINPPSGPCPAADAAEHHTQWTCRSTVSYCAVPMAHKNTHTYTTKTKKRWPTHCPIYSCMAS